MQQRRPLAFTLVEILIVVMILGILASIVVPRYASATDETRRAAIGDQLRVYRDSVSIYRVQHEDRWPGVTTAVPGGTVEMFRTQLTSFTNVVGDVAAAKDSTHRFGPYLPSMPENPISGLNTVKYDWSYDPYPTADSTTGWIYQPFTGRLSVNQAGLDDHGKAFVTY